MIGLDLARREMAVVVNDRLVLGDFVKKPTCCWGSIEKSFCRGMPLQNHHSERCAWFQAVNLEELFEPVMPRQREAKQHVLLLSSTANVMNHQWHASRRLLVADDHDVWQVRWDGASDNVSGQELRSVLRQRELIAFALEPSLQIRNAAVIDAAVGLGESPDFRIGAEVSAHVFVDQLLQVFGQSVTHRPDDHVRANAALARKIATGVTEADVGGIV